MTTESTEIDAEASDLSPLPINPLVADARIAYEIIRRARMVVEFLNAVQPIDDEADDDESEQGRVLVMTCVIDALAHAEELTYRDFAQRQKLRELAQEVDRE